jgi:hypothetical protein
VVYVVTITVVERLPGAPPIRFDGSCIGTILDHIKRFTQPGALRELLASRIGTGSALSSNLGVGSLFILLAALGLFAPLLAVLALRLRKRTSPLFVLFPLLLTANFLAMFLGLALDFNSTTPDELSHRPVMVMYFGVAAWVGGAAALLLIESRRLGRIARPAIVCLTVLLLAVPAFLGSGIQRMWSMRMLSPVRVPLGLHRAAEYMRNHSDARDVFQDSEFDRTSAVAALSERRAYVADALNPSRHNSALVAERLGAIDALVNLRDSAAIVAHARELGLRWYLLTPGSRVEWPEEITGRPAFELGGFRLYRF